VAGGQVVVVDPGRDRLVVLSGDQGEIVDPGRRGWRRAGLGSGVGVDVPADPVWHRHPHRSSFVADLRAVTDKVKTISLALLVGGGADQSEPGEGRRSKKERGDHPEAFSCDFQTRSAVRRGAMRAQSRDRAPVGASSLKGCLTQSAIYLLVV